MSKMNKIQSIQGKECFSRMNFLFQASMLMAGRNNKLASYYGELCQKVGKKAVLRISPDVKRWLCKRCSLAQHPGLTADIQVCGGSGTRRRRKRRRHVSNIDDDTQVQLTCRQCAYTRSFNVNSDYEFWLDNPESIADTVTLQTEECAAAARPAAAAPAAPAAVVVEPPAAAVCAIQEEKKARINKCDTSS